MTYQQVRDILKMIGDFHQRFHAALADAEVATEFELTESLAQQLQDHEIRWQTALRDSGSKDQPNILNSYIQYVPDDAVQHALNSIQITPDMTTSDLRQLVIQFHSALTELYATLKDEVAAPRVKEFFTRLHELEASVTTGHAWAGRAT